MSMAMAMCGMFALFVVAGFPYLQAARQISRLSSSICPGLSPHCGCSWTKNGTLCGARDDGTECFCRCCCPYEKAGFKCKWKPPPPPPLPPAPPPSPPGVTSPADMIKKMGLGINLGNTLGEKHGKKVLTFLCYYLYLIQLLRRFASG